MSERDDSLLSIVEEALRDLASDPTSAGRAGWRVAASDDPDDTWIRVEHDHSIIPDQGWKLHVSATTSSARAVLRRVLPVLFAEDADFKLAASIDKLAELNEGIGGLSQIGKFITVYPHHDAQAVRLAAALDDATSGLAGPAIPSDRPLRPGSLVYYRYGGFGDLFVQTLPGEILPAIATPTGELIPDRRPTSYQPPAWAEDPFLAAGLASELPPANLLIGGRYLIVSTLNRSARGAVHLVADIEAEQRRVLKRAHRDALVDRHGRDAAERLRYEADVLRSLGPDPRWPAVLDLVEEDGELFLVLEDVEGETVEEHLNRLLSYGHWLSGHEVAAWGRELAAILGVIHDRGYVYRDLKSTNVIVGPDGHLRLIDFELAYQPGRPVEPYGQGTIGYMSPQTIEGAAPTVADDVYGLGALLYSLATASEPSTAPRNTDLLACPIELLNPAIGAGLAAVIARCLEHDPARRFASMAEVDAALAALGDDAVAVRPPFGAEQVRTSPAAERLHYRALAHRLGDSLCAVAHEAADGTGRFWVSTHAGQPGLRSRDVNSGNAGTVLALAELVAQLGDPDHRATLAEGARWLAATRPVGQPLPGLFVGEAGVGAALLRAGQVLGDPALIARAEEQGRLVATLPYRSPDLYNGTAGRLRFHLLLWDETGDLEHLRHAVEAGTALLQAAEPAEADGLRWRIPSDYDGLSDHTYPGYAHGAAGIGDALLDLYDATGEQRFLAAAQGAARWLASLAIPTLDDASGLDWPDGERDFDRPSGGLWCHGATGVGRFFLHLSELGVAPDAADLAARAARFVARATRRLSPTHCHGTVGSIEYLLDLYQATGDDTYLAEARSIARVLEVYAREENGLLVWPSEDPAVVTPDYWVGYAGVAVTLLRLADPERLAHQLTRRGFRPLGDLPVSGVGALAHDPAAA